MNDYRQNAWGIQKIEPTEVSTGKDIAGDTALKGAGYYMNDVSKYGKLGLVTGTLKTGAHLLGSKKRQKLQREQLRHDENYNNFVSSLEGRAASRDGTYVPTQDTDLGYDTRYDMRQNKYQARNGLSSNGEVDVEVEKNEIILSKDKNGKYKLKDVFPDSAKSHEEGGYDTTLEDGDVVIPFEKEELEGATNRIKRYMFDDNERTKKWIDGKVRQVPTVEEASEQQGLTAEIGLSNNTPNDNIREDIDYKQYLLDNYKELGLSKYKIRKMSDNDQKELYEREQALKREAGPLGEDQRLNPEQEGMSLDELTGGSSRNNPVIKNSDSRYIISNQEEMNDMEGNVHLKVQELRNKHGKDNPTKEQWNEILDKGLKDSKHSKKDVYNYMKNLGLNVGTSYTPNFFGKLSTKEANNTWAYQEAPSPYVKKENKPLIEKGSETDGKPVNNTEVSSKVIPQDNIEPQGDWNNYEIGDIPNYNNPLKYASIANNYMMGNAPIDRVTRRYDKWDDIGYKDYSESQRQAINQQNAYAQRANRQNVNRSLSHSMNSQSGVQALNAMGQVNEREAAKAYETDKYNQQMHNQYRGANIAKADNYDTMDAQSEAVRQKYKDLAYSETATVAQIDEQRRYMIAKNKKQDDMQMAAMGLMGTENYDVGYDGNTFRTRYRQDDGFEGNVDQRYKYSGGTETWIDKNTGEIYNSRTGKVIGRTS